MAETPFLDLFHHLRSAGLVLTLEQYDLLRQALAQGYGLKGWDDLRRLCRLLWVKPCPNYDAEVFERAFDRYVQQLQRQWQAELEPPATAPIERSTSEDEVELPRVPPRRMPASPPAIEGQAPVAVRTTPPSDFAALEPHFQLTPRQMPVPIEAVRGSWKMVRQRVREGQDYELDLEGTIERINRDGFLSEVVLRPCLVQRAELLVLVDEGEAMVPFRPAIQPLLTAVAEQRISPAQLYRFTVFPDEFLYQWLHPTRAVPLVPLLARLHRSRTVVWIVSDGGAGAGGYNPERLKGVVEFLTRLLPCIRELLWINPVPLERWRGTTAGAIAQVLDGQMIPLDAVSLQYAASNHQDTKTLREVIL